MPENSNMSSPEDSSDALNLGAQSGGAGGSGSRAAQPTQASSLSREGIMPTDDYRNSGKGPDFWTVKVTLLPSASWTAGPDKGSYHYWRLKSRKLIVSTIINGRDSPTIRRHISVEFSAALRGREWIPLQALSHTKTSQIQLSPLSTSESACDQDFNFLADTCLVQNAKGALRLFVAPKHDDLSWDFIRSLPRVLPRSSKIEQEVFWESEVEDGETDDRKDPQTELTTSIDQAFTGKDAQATDPSLSFTTEANRRLPSQLSHATVKTKSKKGKYPCSHVDCLRSRVPFQYQEYLLEHLMGLHKEAPNETCVVEAPSSSTRLVIESAEKTPELSGNSPDTPIQDPSSTSPRVLEAPKSEAPSQDQSSAAVTRSSPTHPIPASGKSVQTDKQPKVEADLELQVLENTQQWYSDLDIRTRPQYCGNSRPNSNAAATLPIDKTRSNNRNDSNKRRRVERNDEHPHESDDDESDDEGRKKAGDKPDSDHNDSIFFACPFYKRYPDEYFRLVCSRGWSKVHRIKEHLSRSHLLPQYQCLRCHQDLKTRAKLQEHLKDPRPCLVSPDPINARGITLEQEKQLRGRKKKLSETEKWTEMFKIVFPDVADDDIPLAMVLPPGRNHSDHTQQGFDTNEYRCFLSRELPSGFMQEIEKRFAEQLQDQLNTPDLNRGALIDKLVKAAQSMQLEIFEHYLRSLPRTESGSLERSDAENGQQETASSAATSAIARLTTALPYVPEFDQAVGAAGVPTVVLTTEMPVLQARPTLPETTLHLVPAGSQPGLIEQQIPRHTDVTFYEPTLELDSEEMDLFNLNYYLFAEDDASSTAVYDAGLPGRLTSGHHGELEKGEVAQTWLQPR